MTLAEVLARNPTGLTAGQLAILRQLMGGSVKTGDLSPEGNVVGDAADQLYLHVSDNTIHGMYLFRGTPGQNTGWITVW